MTQEQRKALEARLRAKWNEDLANQVSAIIAEENITQAALSKLIDINPARLNQWLKGRYTGDHKPIEEAVQRWLDARDAEQELDAKLPEDIGWVRTPSAAAVMAALSFSQTTGVISVIYGGAGVSKTTSIRRYQNMAPNVWVVTATPTVARPGPILHRIAQTLGLRTTGAVHVVESNIIERVTDTRGLIVVDEAQHLCHRSLDSLRAIHDATGIGLTLSGNEIVYSQLTGGNRAIGFAQMFSRVAKRVRLSKPTDGDIDAILDAWKINEPAARKFCNGIARRPGALRGLSQTLRLATMFANQAGRALELEIIRDAWADLGGDA